MSGTRSNIRSLLTDRRGASYSVSVLVILPIYIASLVFAVELLFVAKGYLALRASEEAAVHAVLAWAPQRSALHEGRDSLESVVRKSVLRSMLPFASVGRSNRRPSVELHSVLSAVSLSPKSIDRFGEKYVRLGELVDVKVDDMREPKTGFVVTIRYEVPIYFRFFAPIFANQRGATGPVRVLHLERFVPFSANRMKTKDFGIPYSIREVRQW